MTLCGAPHPLLGGKTCAVELNDVGMHLGWHSDERANGVRWPQVHNQPMTYEEMTRNRGLSFRRDAEAIQRAIQQYEDEHPHPDEGAPCLQAAAEAIRLCLEAQVHSFATIKGEDLFRTEAEKQADLDAARGSAVEQLAQAILEGRVGWSDRLDAPGSQPYWKIHVDPKET